MWPQALQMTKEECRGVLRRLELESYSNVISVFRAQGGLSETKVKVLEELRSLFHISQERHRAEARRVANDEKLSTIADAISGPNTWQEWSREGRRSFPMLPRVAPQTALALIANNIAKEVEAENAKLPYPTDTGVAVAKEQAELNAAKAAKNAPERISKMVTSDPFKVPDIPPISKKNLKRNMPEYHYHNTSSKKRLVNEHAASKIQQYQQQYQYNTKNIAQPQLTTPPSNIRKLYNSHTKMQQQQQLLLMQQQHQMMNMPFQQQTAPAAKTPKTSKKGQKNQTTNKRNSGTPARTGRRSSKLQQQQQQQQQLQQQQLLLQNQHPHPHQYMNSGGSLIPTNSSNLVPSGIDILGDVKDTTASLIFSNANLGETGHSVTALPYTQQKTLNILNSPTSSGAAHISTAKIEKQQIMSPVQKYIVEERQAPLSPVSQLTITTTSGMPSPGSQGLGSPGSAALQVVTLPQVPAVARLRPLNTSIVNPQVSKISGKKVSSISGLTVPVYEESNTSSGQQAVFNTLEAGQSAVNTSQSTSGLAQLQGSEINTSVSSSTTNQASTQGKVITTKIMPLVLSGNNGNVAKVETVSASSLPSNIPSVPAGTIIKSLPASVLLSSNQSSSTGTSSTNASIIPGAQVIPTLCSGTTIFRKAPNILKSAKSSQFISNFKLTPVTTSTTTQSTFIKNIGTPGLRANVKICQSPNGKVFIQPANLNDTSKGKLQTANASGVHHKLLPTMAGSGISTTVTSGAGNSSGTPQRIAIQKVQIIPAPLNSPGSLSSGVGTQKPTSLKFANNNNMIFMPSSSANSPVVSARPITISKAGIISAKPSAAAIKTAQDIGKSNLVVIGSGTNTSKTTSLIFDNNGKTSNSPGPLLTEDTPVDILNIPMIVQSTDCGITESDIATAEALTVLAQEPKLKRVPTSTASHNQQTFSSSTSHQSQQSIQQEASMVVIGATDWELELDQAAANANIKKANLALYQQQKSVKENRNSSQRQTDVICSDPLIIDERFSDEIIVEDQINSKHNDENQEIIVIDDMKQSIIEIPPSVNQQQLSQDIKSTSLEDCFIVLDEKGDQVPSNEYTAPNSIEEEINVEDGEDKTC